MAAREVMYPKKQRSRSGRARGQDPKAWGSLLGSKLEEQSKRDDHPPSVVGSKRKRAHKSSEIKGADAKLAIDLEAAMAAIDFPQPKNRGKRSARPRATKAAAPWAASLDGFQNNGAGTNPVVKHGVPATVSYADLDVVATDVDLSSAESALASLYGERDRDPCVEFAVNILMNGTPLPKEAAGIEAFFTQKMYGYKNAKFGENITSFMV